MALLDLFGVRIDPKLPYMSDGERATFRRLREGNAISFFRVGACFRCGGEIPKSKKFCSKSCYEEEVRRLAEKIANDTKKGKTK